MTKGTGSINECGLGNGQNYCLNVPLLSGIDDSTYTNLFKELTGNIFEFYKPQVIVIQCGADSLYGDPSAFKESFNLSSKAYCDCIKLILDTKISTIFLGGGGYNLANTARLWTQLTSLICNNNEQLSNDIPEHDYYLNYSPDYELNVNSSRQVRNENSEDYIREILKTLVNNNLKQIDILKV
jgi:acetoin utilization deacetylase AcuC-like enzyme